MKKIKVICALLCEVLLLTACDRRTENTAASVPTIVSVPTESSSVVFSSSAASTSTSTTTQISEPPSEPAPYCKACALYCVEDGEVLYAENINDRIAPASLTKIITASVALRYVKADEIVTVGSELELVQPDSSLAFIAPGQRLTMYDLLTGMLLPSGNDAAYTTAAYTARRKSGSANMSDKHAVSYFCDLMNDHARELGMDNSHFVDPDGWDEDAHYTTVSDLIKAAKYALSVPEIREIVAIRKKDVVFESGERITWYNGNKLLHPESEFYCKNAIGMKTGFTDNAGLCLISAFEKKGKTYIIIVVGCTDDRERYRLILDLFNKIK